MKEIDIGELLKDKFADFEQTPPDDMWKKIMQNEKVLRYNKAHFVKRAILYSTTVLVIVAVVSLLLFITIGNDNNSSLLPNNNQSQNQVHNTESILPDDSNGLSIENETVVEALQKQSTNQNTIDNENNSVLLTPDKSDKIAPMVKTIVPNTPTQSKSLSDIGSHNVTNTNENSISDTKVVNRSDGQDKVITSQENPDSEQQINTNPIEPPQTDISNNSLFIPKGFTPNSDGLNDQFLVYSSYEVQNFELSIFDQSGRLLFRSRDISIGWDGESYGKIMQAGAYVYVINYKDITGKSHLEKGQVVLIR